MCPTRVRVYFNNPTVRFAPGERISGKVILSLCREKQVLGIDMNLIGKAKVTYVPTDSRVARSNGRRVSSYRDKYFIIKDCKSLQRGEGDGTVELRLPMGEYEYPFSWTLPENIPASFEGPYGWIRYRMEVVVRHSFWDHRCEAEAEFYVTGNYDLNNLDRAFREVQVENKWVHVYNAYGSIYMELTFELERRAYAPGETIRFAATADFQCPGSHPPIPGVRVALVQEQTYKIKDKIKRHASKIHEVSGPLAFCNAIEVWNGSMEVLPMAPTALGGGCRFIDIQYYIRVHFGITESDKVDMSIKLQIGTIPIQRQRRRPRPISDALAREFSTSIELPPSPPVIAPPEETLPSNIPATDHNAITENMDFLSVQPGPSRRASAPPLWVEPESTNGPVYGPSPATAPWVSHTGEPETPPPTYTDALFLSSVGFLEQPASSTNDDPPAYPRQPPFFLRKGAKHLYDSNNIYSTL